MDTPPEFTFGRESTVSYDSPRTRPLPQPRCFPTPTLQRTFSVEQQLICPPVMTTAQKVFLVESKAPTAFTRVLYDHRAASNNRRVRRVEDGEMEMEMDFSLDDIMLIRNHERSPSPPSESDHGLEEEEEPRVDRQHIPERIFVHRPKGSLSDLSRKGYTLESVWTVKGEDLQKVKASVLALTQARLDIETPLGKQDRMAVQAVFSNINARHPNMLSYEFEKDWMYRSLVRQALKNLKQRRDRNAK